LGVSFALYPLKLGYGKRRILKKYAPFLRINISYLLFVATPGFILEFVRYSRAAPIIDELRDGLHPTLMYCALSGLFPDFGFYSYYDVA